MAGNRTHLIFPLLLSLLLLQACSAVQDTVGESKELYSTLFGGDEEEREYFSDKPVVMFILDTSISMNKIDAKGDGEETLLDTAKKSIINTISQIDRDRYNTSLITFNNYSTCKATLAVAPDNNDADNVVSRIRSVTADSNTPLSAAIKMSGRVLENVDKKLVILFSDGLENCGGSPVSAARALDEKYGIKLNMQVIGYNVDQPTQFQLQKIARVNPAWAYHSAQDPATLSRAINTITRDGDLLAPIWQDVKTSTFQFSTGSTDLQQEYMDKIRRLFAYLKNNEDDIVITGHTDSVGDSASNLALSVRRANIVKDNLLEMGIAAGRIATEGRGEAEPVSDNDTVQGRHQNRRVVIRILSD